MSGQISPAFGAAYAELGRARKSVMDAGGPTTRLLEALDDCETALAESDANSDVRAAAQSVLDTTSGEWVSKAFAKYATDDDDIPVDGSARATALAALSAALAPNTSGNLPSIARVADLKRRLTPGTRIMLVEHPRPNMIGQERTVTKTTSKGIVMSLLDGNEATLDWPKASEYQPDQDKEGFTVTYPDVPGTFEGFTLGYALVRDEESFEDAAVRVNIEQRRADQLVRYEAAVEKRRQADAAEMARLEAEHAARIAEHEQKLKTDPEYRAEHEKKTADRKQWEQRSAERAAQQAKADVIAGEFKTALSGHQNTRVVIEYGNDRVVVTDARNPNAQPVVPDPIEGRLFVGDRGNIGLLPKGARRNGIALRSRGTYNGYNTSYVKTVRNAKTGAVLYEAPDLD